MDDAEIIRQVKEVGEEIAAGYPDGEKKLFVKEFERVMVPLEISLTRSFVELETNLIPLMEAASPYTPASVAVSADKHTTHIRNLVGATITHLMNIRYNNMRLELIDSMIECLQETRNSLAGFDHQKKPTS